MTQPIGAFSDDKSKRGYKQVGKNFLIGGLSGMIATTFIQPADMLKTRIQIASEAKVNSKPHFVLQKIMQQSGVKGLYVGLDSALLRQFVYCGMRLGIYFNMSEHLKRKNSQENLTIMQKAYCSLFAGILGSTACTPLSLILTRFQADRTLPPPFRRNYSNVFTAIGSIAKNEGVVALWTGGQITMLRACAMNMGMMVTYDEGKETLIQMMPQGNRKLLEVLASIMAAVVCGAGSLPFDNVKTKLQKQYRTDQGTRQYSGIADCFSKTIKGEGFRALWVGLPTYYCRVGPHALITLQAAEWLRKYFDA